MPRKKETTQVRRKYEFIKAKRGEHSVRMMCRLLDVAPSGYYDWLKKPMPDRAKEDARLLRLIRSSFKASQGVCGAPRVFLDLREVGETCSKHRVARLMRENNMRAVADIARADMLQANRLSSSPIWSSEISVSRSLTVFG